MLFTSAATRRLRRLRPTLWIAVAGVLVGGAILSLLEAPILARPPEADSGQRLLVAAAFLGAVLCGVTALRYYLIYRRRPAVMLISPITAFVAYSAYAQYRREGSPAGLFHGVALSSTVTRLRRSPRCGCGWG